LKCLIKLPEKATLLQTDVKRLTQVISNIVNNARKFTLKGHILIGYEEGPENGQVSLFIEDTGVGIPKELQEKIFGRVHQVGFVQTGHRHRTCHQPEHHPSDGRFDFVEIRA
jgi:signal transduction histidine kinase